MPVKKYVKKPVVIEAVQWTGDNAKEILDFAEGDIVSIDDREGVWEIEIATLEGNHTARKGDFIIRGVKGEHYPCKPDIFVATYDGVKENDTRTE